jgi:hypothetical protein
VLTAISVFYVSQAAVFQTPLSLFPDVSSQYPFSSAISFVYQKGVMKGYPNGNFGPTDTIDRAQLTTIIVRSRIQEDAVRQCTQKSFSDVPTSAWYSQYICAAQQAGIVSGYSDGTFRPGNPVSVVEASKILVLGFHLPVSDHIVSQQLWFMPYVSALVQKNAFPSTYVDPEQHVTRGEIAYQIQSILKESPTTSQGNSSMQQSSGYPYGSAQSSQADTPMFSEGNSAQSSTSSSTHSIYTGSQSSQNSGNSVNAVPSVCVSGCGALDTASIHPDPPLCAYWQNITDTAQCIYNGHLPLPRNCSFALNLYEKNGSCVAQPCRLVCTQEVFTYAAPAPSNVSADVSAYSSPSVLIGGGANRGSTNLPDIPAALLDGQFNGITQTNFFTNQSADGTIIMLTAQWYRDAGVQTGNTPLIFDTNTRTYTKLRSEGLVSAMSRDARYFVLSTRNGELILDRTTGAETLLDLPSTYGGAQAVSSDGREILYVNGMRNEYFVYNVDSKSTQTLFSVSSNEDVSLGMINTDFSVVTFNVHIHGQTSAFGYDRYTVSIVNRKTGGAAEPLLKGSPYENQGSYKAIGMNNDGTKFVISADIEHVTYDPSTFTVSRKPPSPSAWLFDRSAGTWKPYP